MYRRRGTGTRERDRERPRDCEKRGDAPRKDRPKNPRKAMLTPEERSNLIDVLDDAYADLAAGHLEPVTMDHVERFIDAAGSNMPFGKANIMRNHFALSSCDDASVGGFIIRNLSDRHAFFNKDWVRSWFMGQEAQGGRGGRPSYGRAAEKGYPGPLFSLLTRAVEMCGETGVDVDVKVLNAAVALNPGIAHQARGVIETLEAAETRRKQLEAEAAKGLRAGVNGPLGTYSGIPRDQLEILPPPEVLRGEAPPTLATPVSTAYASTDVMLNTLTSLEREDFSIKIRQCTTKFFKGEVVDHRDMARLEGCVVQGVGGKEADWKRSSEFPLRVAVPKPARAAPATMGHGNILLLSSDGFQSIIAAKSLGFDETAEERAARIEKEKAEREREGEEGAPRVNKAKRHRKRGTVWGSTLLVTLMPDVYDTQGASLEALLTQPFEMLAFGDALLPAYLPVVRNLMTRESEDMPFGSVIAGYDQQYPKPSWVRETMDISSLYHPNHGPLPYSTRHPWPGEIGGPPVPDGLTCEPDPTQMRAIRHGLNNAVAIIRGGPGTGKSYTARQLLQFLLMAFKNRTLTGPILIVTETNQALDTLMESCLAFAEASDVIRIGGSCGSENEKIIARCIQNCRYEVSRGDAAMYDCRDRVESLYTSLYSRVQQLVVFQPLERALLALRQNQIRATDMPLAMRQELCDLVRQLLGDTTEGGSLSLATSCPIPPERIKQANNFNAKPKRVLQPLPNVAFPHMKTVQEMWTQIQRHFIAYKDCEREMTAVLSRLDASQGYVWLWLTGDHAPILNALAAAKRACVALTSKPQQKAPTAPAVNPFAALQGKGRTLTEAPEEGAEGAESGATSVALALVESFGQSGVGDGWRRNQDRAGETYTLIRAASSTWRLNPSLVWSHLIDKMEKAKRSSAASEREREYDPYEDMEEEGVGSSILRDLKKLMSASVSLKESRDRGLLRGITEHRIAIIGMTSTKAADNIQFLREAQPSVMVVEEAGELRESQLLACMAKSLKHLVLIGDEQQLRPKVAHELIKHHHFDKSLFERLTEMGYPRVQLTTQRRMRGEICGLINSVFDQGLETGHPASTITSQLRSIPTPVFYLQHMHKQDNEGENSRSYCNAYEADMIVNLIPVLCGNGFRPADITVIAMYKGQMFMIRRKLKKLHERLALVELQQPSQKTLGSCDLQTLSEVRVVCLDDYQGQENQVILVSLVRSDRPGFVKDRNRALVTLSRAKEVMVVLGCREVFGVESRSKHWRDTAEYFQARPSPLVATGPGLPLGCAQHGARLVYKRPEQLVPGSGWAMGGCQHPCDTRLLCGHLCTLPCHGGDHRSEAGFRCMETCTKRCVRGHRCTATCHLCSAAKKCRSCTVLVDNTFPCGHSAPIPCHSVDNDPVCMARCGRTLRTCGHLCTLPCGHEDTCESAKCVQEVPTTCPTCDRRYSLPCDLLRTKGPACGCTHPCTARLSCGHPCVSSCGACSERRSHSVCDMPHGRLLTCGHYCSKPCQSHESTECSCGNTCDMASCSHGVCPAKCSDPCPSCQGQCTLGCRHQRCVNLCSEPCSCKPCNKACALRLECGCFCRGLCGEACPPCPEHEAEAYKGQVSIIDQESIRDIVLEDSQERVYYIPSCGHLFLVDEIDMSLRVWWEDVQRRGQLNPRVTCPGESCRHVLTLLNAPRYRDIIRGVVARNNRAKYHAAKAAAAGRERERAEEAQAVEARENLTPEEWAQVKQALTEEQAGGYDLNGRIFEHGCGYIYVIADCGGAKVKTKCPQCGGTLGGENYRLVDGNRLATGIEGNANMAWGAMEDGERLPDSVTDQQKREHQIRRAQARREAEEKEVAERRRNALTERTRRDERERDVTRDEFALANAGNGEEEGYHAYQLVDIPVTAPEMSPFVLQLQQAGAREVTKIRRLDHPRYYSLRRSGKRLTPAWHGTSMRNIERSYTDGGVTNGFRGVNGQAHGPGVYMARTPQMGYSREGDVGGDKAMLLHYVDMGKATKTSPIVLPDDASFALRYVFFFQ
ncbi:hypothetical protein KIPB_003818 [Kipferlia bialata]|uniref:RZ-type domain-containing protein n=1 Tax=Kipferlia bialata TaxID=797122 RepID=A0A9K3GG28_9EUKA|nr:hypothetical protein KIPB_003818 [Kipferlia bialata]|eukprot:g3818.t1